MNVVKSVFLGVLFTLGTSFTAHAQSLNSAEKSTLATIATIDKNEILISVVAENKKVSSDVIDFAKMMINQHGSNLAQILDMEQQLKTGPLTGGESETLAKQGKEALIKIGGLDGDAFASAYADAMVKGHEGALNLIDTKLMKTAKTDEMKKFLTDTRAAVQMHLEHAKKMQADLSKS